MRVGTSSRHQTIIKRRPATFYGILTSCIQLKVDFFLLISLIIEDTVSGNLLRSLYSN